MLLEYDNVKLFSFSDFFDVTCNLDNYKDDTHYSDKISDGDHPLDPRWKRTYDQRKLWITDTENAGLLS